jgi:hypothetical protein
VTFPKLGRHLPVLVQTAGVWILAVGIWMQFGLAIALMAVGLALAALGTLREAGRI